MSSARTPDFADFRTVGEIVAALAGASAVFRPNKIDSCCGGNVSLEEAARDRGIDPAAICAQLSELQQVAPDAPQGSVELVDYIVTRYHDVHRRELPELIQLARRVETVHREHDVVPAGLAQILETAQAELEDHMQKEEQISLSRDPLGLLGVISRSHYDDATRARQPRGHHPRATDAHSWVCAARGRLPIVAGALQLRREVCDRSHGAHSPRE